MHEGKIFGFGLNETGTNSPIAALEVLGCRTIHRGRPLFSARRVQDGFEKAATVESNILPGHAGSMALLVGALRNAS